MTQVFLAPAKLNLSLEILGRRPDGYHELVSVMQTVALFDRLTVTPAPELTFSCTDPALANDNLVMRAAIALREHVGNGRGAHIHLEKHIPVAAGLAGGSSDAATALVALSRFWHIELSPDEVCRIAAAIGSDVPFFLSAGTCLVRGRGERVAPLPFDLAGWYLLVNPGIAVPTPEVFRALAPGDWSNGDATSRLIEQLAAGDQCAIGPNGLENAVFDLFPPVRECYTAVSSLAPRGARLSGSGATIFAPFTHEAEARAAAAALEHPAWWTRVVRAAGRNGSDETRALSPE